ncbi:MAG: GAF domain-containing protein, partial [Anaerolineales bacterium]|nr:GAF domain-containing protein [Anaerolineales bacterium]
IAAEAVVIFAALPLVQRGHVKRGGWVLLATSLIATALISFLYVRIGYVAVAYNLVAGFLFIRYVLPNESRRLAMGFVVIELGISIATEIFNPGWREVSQLMLTISPILTTTLGAAFLVVLVRQAWRGNIRLKLVTAFTIVALISTGILGSVVYIDYRNKVHEDLRQRLLNIISLVAMNQDGDLHSTIRGPEDAKDESHLKILAQNVKYLSTDPNLKYIYTMRKNEQGQIYFVINARQGGEPGDPIGTIYNEPSDLLRTKFDTLSGPVIEEGLYTDVYGSVLASYAPFYRSDGTLEGIIGVDLDAEKILAEERSVLNLILGTTLVTMIIVVLIGLFLGNLFVRPIVNLSSVAQKITEGDLDARAKIETADEVSDLAIAFNKMTSQLQETLQGLEIRVAARTKDLATVAEVGTATATILESKQLLQEVVNLTKERFNLYHSHIYLLDEAGENLVLTAGAGEPGRIMVAEKRSIPLDREQSLVARAARDRKGVTVNDVTQAPDFLPNPLLPETRSELAVPMIIGGRVIGVFDIQSEQIGRFTDADVNVQTTLAAQLAASIQNVRTYEQSKAQAELESLVNTISQKIQRTTSVEDTLQTAVREIGLALGASRVSANIGASIRYDSNEAKNN